MADDLPHKAGTGAFDPHKTRLFHSAGPPAQSSGRPRKRPPPLPAARPDWHSKTRVLPIELLVPGLRKPLQAARLDTAILKKRARRISKQRVYAWAVCLVLWVSVAAASGVPSQTPQTPQSDAVTIRTAIPVAERPREALPRPAAPSTATRERPKLPTTPAAKLAPVRPTPPSPARVSARAAIEALAAGDTLTASHLYAALAQQHPDNLAYARAARTLTQRVAAEAKMQGQGATP